MGDCDAKEGGMWKGGNWPGCGAAAPQHMGCILHDGFWVLISCDLENVCECYAYLLTIDLGGEREKGGGTSLMGMYFSVCARTDQ